MVSEGLLPMHDFGGDGETIHFAHANAYPPGAYNELLAPLTKEHAVIAYKQRPLWSPSAKPESINNWFQLADDLIDFLDQQRCQRIIGIGHSLGAVTSFMAACKRPDLFRALVMIEPVTFSYPFCLFNRWLPWLLKSKVPIIKKALRRPDCWENQQQAFDFHRKTRAFSRVSDVNLWHYIRAGVVEDNGEWKLAYSKLWEARCYGTISYFRGRLLESDLPILAMRGEHTETIPLDFWHQWKRNTNHLHIQFANTGHLLPLEQPQLLAPEIIQFISQHPIQQRSVE